jgi:hypothetical protein
MTSNMSPRIGRKLVEDFPGEHWYVFICCACQREISEEWIERRWGSSETPAEVRPHSCDGQSGDLGGNAQGNAPEDHDCSLLNSF